METTKQVHSRGGWQEDEINVLFQAVRTAAESGQALRDVFADVAEELKRKPNSIRNFYYARLRELPDMAARKAPFRTFDQSELHELLRTVLMARGRGESVRACVTRMAEGDRGLMLRYQNKYRSILKNRPEMLEAVAAELRAEGLPCPTQVASGQRFRADTSRLGDVMEESMRLSEELGDDLLPLLLTRVCELYRRVREAESKALYRAMEDRVQGRADNASHDNPCPDLEITVTDLRAGELEAEMEKETDEFYNRFLEARREADRLRVQVDLLKLHLEDTENQHRGEMKQLRDTVHEFLSLPQDRRAREMDSFVNRAGEALQALDLEEEMR